MRAGSRIRVLAVAGMFVGLALIGARNLQLGNFDLFIGLLIGLVAAVLLVFAATSDSTWQGRRGRRS